MDESTTKSEQQEAAHLAFIYQELVQAEKKLSDFLSVTKQESLTALKELSGETRVSFDSVSETLDSFANIESLNKQIDQYNAKLVSAKKASDGVRRLKPAPYFGKVAVKFEGEEEQTDFYFGVNGFASQGKEDLIYDWRSPIAELFYNHQLGPSLISRATENLAIVTTPDSLVGELSMQGARPFCEPGVE